MPGSITHAARLLAPVVAAALLGGCVGGGSASTAPIVAATNAPVSQGVSVQPGTEEDFVVNVGRRTFFKEGSAEIDETARVTLDSQAAWLTRYPSWKVKVQGFADDGAGDRNTALSLRRAETARSYLASKGVSAERMQAKGYCKDPERLIRDCTDPSCKAQNRRVVTNLQETSEL